MGRRPEARAGLGRTARSSPVPISVSLGRSCIAEPGRRPDRHHFDAPPLVRGGDRYHLRAPPLARGTARHHLDAPPLARGDARHQVDAPPLARGADRHHLGAPSMGHRPDRHHIRAPSTGHREDRHHLRAPKIDVIVPPRHRGNRARCPGRRRGSFPRGWSRNRRGSKGQPFRDCSFMIQDLHTGGKPEELRVHQHGQPDRILKRPEARDFFLS
jgi:hypothetical protein